jgi:hypothetical protein
LLFLNEEKFNLSPSEGSTLIVFRGSEELKQCRQKGMMLESASWKPFVPKQVTFSEPWLSNLSTADGGTHQAVRRTSL